MIHSQPRRHYLPSNGLQAPRRTIRGPKHRYVVDYCCTIRIYLSNNCVPQSQLMFVKLHPYILLSYTKHRDNPPKDLTCLGITSISIRTLWSFTPVSVRKLVHLGRITGCAPDPTERFIKAITVEGTKVTVQVSAIRGVDSVNTAQNRTR